MEYRIQLSFLRQLLKDMNIDSCVIENPSSQIPPCIDLHLRANLFGLDNYAVFLQNSMALARDNTIYRFYDEYSCSYIFMRLPGQDAYFFIGPYLLSLPSAKQVEKKAQMLNLTEDQLRQMQLYYTSLPLIEDENLLLGMTKTLALHLWGSPEQYTMEYVDYTIPDRHEPIPYSLTTLNEHNAAFNLSTLEQNYANENQLMEAVSKGKLHMVTTIASTVFNNGSEQRLSDSLRDRKNYLVMLKTLLRKAAEYGGVHPLHIHKLSSHYAAAIEKIHTIRQSMTLQEEMIRSFCQLVKKHSISQYSYYVGQTITLVQYDLTADLSLKTISEQLSVNSSYLSNLFHQEYGCTLTEFINRQRIGHGILLLQTSSRSVQEIALECGFQDVNYFIKLFKKQTGFTPNLYRKQLGAHAR